MPVNTSQIIDNGAIKVDSIRVDFHRNTAEVSYVVLLLDSDGTPVVKRSGFVQKSVAIPFLVAKFPPARTLYDELEKLLMSQLPAGVIKTFVPNTDVDITVG